MKKARPGRRENRFGAGGDRSLAVARSWAQSSLVRPCMCSTWTNLDRLPHPMQYQYRRMRCLTICDMEDGAASMLTHLPHDVLVQVMCHTDAVTLLSASQASTALCRAVNDPSAWHALCWRHHGQVLQILFDGTLPPPPQHGLSWKQRYFEFVQSWKRTAQQRNGRLLLRIDCSASDGVPGTYGVYDATHYAPSHPGLDAIVADAAEEEDSTSTFAAASHTSQARALLRSLAVPGLENLRYNSEDAQLVALRRRRARQWYVLRLRRWGAPAATLLLPVAILLPQLARDDTLHRVALWAWHRLAAMAPDPAAPWVAACVATSLSVYEWTCEGVGAFAVVVLLVTLNALGVRVVVDFFVDLFVTPAAVCALALVPIAVAISKRHTRKHPISYGYAY